jgi:hypothetical protein
MILEWNGKKQHTVSNVTVLIIEINFPQRTFLVKHQPVLNKGDSHVFLREKSDNLRLPTRYVV